MQDAPARAPAWRPRAWISIAAPTLAMLGGAAWAALAPPQYRVSQKDQAFNPGELGIKRG